MLRRPYTVKALPFSDASDEIDLVWYPCLPDAPDLGRGSLMASQDWDADGQTWLPGGEVPGAAMPYNAEPTKPGALGARVCGTVEMFREGCPKDETIPPSVYGGNGLPVCCPAVLLGGGGGAGGGRAAVVSWMRQDCTLAPTVPLGALCRGEFDGVFFHQWAKVAVEAGQTLHHNIGVDSGQVFLRFWQGQDCNNLALNFEQFLNPPGIEFDWGSSVDQFFYVQLVDQLIWPYPIDLSYTPSEV